jgi:hypothetical protein
MARFAIFVGLLACTTLAASPADGRAQDDAVAPDGPTGTFAPAGPPSRPPQRTDVGGACVVELEQPYTMAGPLSGRLVIDYRILVHAACADAAPGAAREEWIAHGRFEGGSGAAGSGGMATLWYTADVGAGGAVEGRMRLSGGVDATLDVTGRFGDGRLTYTVVSDGASGGGRP